MAKKNYFAPVDLKISFPEMEKKLLAEWYRKGIVKKYLAKNRKAEKRFSFLDGPITANNPMGVHHAWGRTYKDLWQRFKNMQGFKQRFQNGFDCQGLWVEVGVEKDLGFNSKKDIEKFGLENFAKACRQTVDKFSALQTEQSKRLGQFMDWDNSYYTFTDTNIEYIWYFLRKCQEKGWLYKGFRSLPWCARCGTSLSQHELADSYQEMTHKSVFFQLPIVGREKEYFLVWTTTPWTLTANVALAVNPELVYVKVKIGDKYLILAKSLMQVLQEKYQVISEFKGTKLVDLKYQGPFDELPAQRRSQRTVLPWKDVLGTDGTGIVHIAPGCGEEDFDLGKKNKLEVLVPLDENGLYVSAYGGFTGRFVRDVENDIFASLEKKGLLYKIEDFTHNYPVCWRCKEPIVFRAEENWFIAADEIRPKMIREAGKVGWRPAYVGKLMRNWLENMDDWNISRKRYFGLPLPFYECACGQTTVVKSKKELKELAVDPDKVDQIPELHRPWIDAIKIKCPKCGKEVARISDIGDCWLDAGIVPFSTLKYLEDRKYWLEWFPADWISEMREQIRLWFYSMLFMSVTLEEKTPYLQVLSYEKAYDEKGKPMHKSAGNAIWFDEAAEKMGADVMRWMYVRQNPADNLPFGYKIADETRRRFHLKLWNVYNYFVTYANLDNWQPSSSKIKLQNILDLWIFSRLNQTIKSVTKFLEKYDAYNASAEIEKFVDDLSNWYIRRSRDREDKKDFYQTTYNVLTTLVRLLAPFTPFLSDAIYKNLTKEESVHLSDWPIFDQKAIYEEVEQKMQFVRDICEAGHAKRKEVKIAVRQPLSQITVQNAAHEIGDYVQLVSKELNVKSVVVKTGKGDLRVDLETKITPELKAEGEAREIIRSIQDERKSLGTDLDERVDVVLPDWPEDFENDIKQAALVRDLKKGPFKVTRI